MERKRVRKGKGELGEGKGGRERVSKKEEGGEGGKKGAERGGEGEDEYLS